MAWNMPAGCSPADYDRWCGYDRPDEEEARWDTRDDDPVEEFPPAPPPLDLAELAFDTLSTLNRTLERAS